MTEFRNRIWTDSESKKLASAVEMATDLFSVCRDQWYGNVSPLLEGGAVSQSDRQEFERLRQRLETADRSFHSDVLAPDGSFRRIMVPLPGAGQSHVSLHSRIVPGTAFATWFKHGYPENDVEIEGKVTRLSHLPDLEQTVLTDADGRLLFSGLRHSATKTDPLTTSQFSWLPDDERKTLIRVAFESASDEEIESTATKVLLD